MTVISAEKWKEEISTFENCYIEICLYLNNVSVFGTQQCAGITNNLFSVIHWSTTRIVFIIPYIHKRHVTEY
jgi:hypothetical protein